MASIKNISSAAKSSILLSLAILLLLNAPASCSSDSYSNVLSSGYPLNAGGSLVQGKYNFTMQHDCNLVLYKSEVAIWSSRTNGMGASNCSLVLQNNGELFISTAAGIVVWRSETGGEYGHYVLVIQPNGDVVVYGGAVWSTGTYTAPDAISDQLSDIPKCLFLSGKLKLATFSVSSIQPRAGLLFSKS